MKLGKTENNLAFHARYRASEVPIDFILKPSSLRFNSNFGKQPLTCMYPSTMESSKILENPKKEERTWKVKKKENRI